MDINKRMTLPTNISLGLRSNLSQATYTLRVLSALKTCEPPTGKTRILDDLKESVSPTWNKQLNQLITGFPPKDRDDLAKAYFSHDTTTELTRDPVETHRTEKTANISNQELKNLLDFNLTGPLDEKPTFRLTLTLGDFSYDEAHFQWVKELRECFFNWTEKNRITGDCQRFQKLVSKGHGLYQQLPTGNAAVFSELAKTADEKNRCFPIFLYERLIEILMEWYKGSDVLLHSIDNYHAQLLEKALSFRTEGMQLLEKGLGKPARETIPSLEIANQPDWVWDPESETLDIFNNRVREAVNLQVKQYTDAVLTLNNWKTIPESRASYHFAWFVRFQFYEEPLYVIAGNSDDNDSNRKQSDYQKSRRIGDVKARLKEIASQVGIRLR